MVYTFLQMKTRDLRYFVHDSNQIIWKSQYVGKLHSVGM